MTSYAQVFAGVYTAIAAHAQAQDAGDTDGMVALRPSTVCSGWRRLAAIASCASGIGTIPVSASA